jgi:DmsE family decaheme c-type cytochrome
MLSTKTMARYAGHSLAAFVLLTMAPYLSYGAAQEVAPDKGAAPHMDQTRAASKKRIEGSAPKQFGEDYAGSQTCQTCHEDIYNNYRKSAHTFVETDKRGGWSEHGCESCHGPGAAHAGSGDATAIWNPAKLQPAETDSVCLGCHRNTAKHSERIMSGHAKSAVACTTCHSMHSRGPAGLVQRAPADVNALCSSCHLSAKAQFAKPSHHKVPENSMTCVDCHNPHGSVRPGMVQTFASNDAACIKCHGDKRGPFTYEHAPMRQEGCGACHESHGSTNPRLLTRQEVRLTCLECHSNIPGTANQKAGVVPPAFHDLRSPRYANCTVCHQKIHGSYTDRNLLR